MPEPMLHDPEAAKERQVACPPLAGLKVLDLSRFIAGPHCTMILGDMGADVVKVEKKGVGDDSRHFPPFQNGESLYGMGLNRNKRSIALDFRDRGAQDLLRQMAAEADVLVENFRPGTMEKMGCGWEDLHQTNPRLVMTRLSGFGQDGPYAQRPGFDGIAQAMSGLMELTGAPDGPPMLGGTFYIDYMTGMYGATATLGALMVRHATGLGQMVDVSLLDSASAMLTTALSTQISTGTTLTRQGNRDRYSAPANVFATKSGDYVLLLAGTDGLFRRLAAAMGRMELTTDIRFSTVAERLDNVEALERIVGEWIASLATGDALAALEEAGIPSAKVATPADVAFNPQLRHREQIVELDHPTAGKVAMAGVTMRLSATPLSIRQAPPRLGEHTAEVLGEWLGIGPDAIIEMRDKGML